MAVCCDGSQSGSFTSGRGCRGFTLFELIVVVVIISVLVAFALGYYRKLLVEVEQSTLEYNLGTLRSALTMQFAGRFAAGESGKLEQLIGCNPMELLAERPKNYLGAFGHKAAVNLTSGNWYFDSDLRALIYLVRHTGYFNSPLEGTPRIRFKVYPVYSVKGKGKGKGKQTIRYISGLELRPMEPYRWLSPNLLQKRKS